MPAVLKIWEHGGATPLKENVRQLALWETRAYTGLLRGEHTMATPSVRVPIICCFPFRREYYVHGKLIGFSYTRNIIYKNAPGDAIATSMVAYSDFNVCSPTSP